MKKANILINICFLSTFITLSGLSALGESNIESLNPTSTILNSIPAKSMIVTNIENNSSNCKNLIFKSSYGAQSINSDLDDLKNYAIKESKDSEKIEKAIKNTNSETAPIGPSVINPQKTITLDDIDDFEDNENSGIKIKVLTKEKPENSSL